MKRAVKFYLSLHFNFYRSTDVVFLTDPPAVLGTDTVEVYDSSDVHDALNSTYENLVSAIEDFQQRGSGWILDKLVALDLHLLEFDLLHTFHFLHAYRTRKQQSILKTRMKSVFYGLLLLVYMEILIEKIMNVYLVTWSMRRNSTFKVFHFQWL